MSALKWELSQPNEVNQWQSDQNSAPLHQKDLERERKRDKEIEKDRERERKRLRE